MTRNTPEHRTNRLRPLSRNEARSLDQAAEAMGLPTLALMENAGRHAASWLRQRLTTENLTQGDNRKDVLILCGPGNNGGDGAVLARHLDAAGVNVRVRWIVAGPDRIVGDAQRQYGILELSGLDQHCLDPRDDGDSDDQRLCGDLALSRWVVDGLLGTGLSRPVSGAMRRVIARTNASGLPVLALDLPSGLDADTGALWGETILAQATVTFVAEKQGFFTPEAREKLGEVIVADIGLPGILLKPYRTPFP